MNSSVVNSYCYLFSVIHLLLLNLSRIKGDLAPNSKIDIDAGDNRVSLVSNQHSKEIKIYLCLLHLLLYYQLTVGVNRP